MWIKVTSVAAIFVLTSIATADELEPITVKSTPFPNETEDVIVQNIEIIHGKELDRKKTDTIGETLKNELGVSSTYFAPGASRPIIRGLGSNRVRVLENGIDSLDVSSASEDHAVTIEPYFADQIEIIRGPATLRYGPGAIGGIVNVINDRIPQSLELEPFEINGLVEHATVSDGNTAAVELNGAINSFAWNINGLTRDTNDYEIDGFANEAEPEDEDRLSNSDVETDNYGIGGSFIGERGMIGFAFNRFDSDYGIPGAEEGDIRIDLRQYRYDNQIELFNPFSGIESISLRSTYNNYRHFEIEEEGDIATTFENEELESRLEIINIIGDWQNAFGFQYNDREFAAVGEEAFVEPVDEKRYGLFAITHYHQGAWDYEAGLRYDRDEFEPDSGDDEEFDVFSISFGAARTLANDLKVSLYAARAERAPQETALYADGPHLATLTFETGSTDIDEETSFNIELGIEQNKENYAWKVNTFYNYIDDYIFLNTLDENGDGIADRVDEEGEFELDGELLNTVFENEDAEFYGIEAEFTSKLVSNQSFNIDGRIFADYVRAEFDDNDLGNVPRITPPRFGLGLVGTRGSWDGSLDLTFVTDQNNEADLEDDTDGYTMLNAEINKTFFANDADVIVSLKGTNLLDEDARQHESFTVDRVVLPGRGVELGVSLRY